MRIAADAGSVLYDVLAQAAAEADAANEPAQFEFNGVEHEVLPFESVAERHARAESRCGFPIRTHEEMAEEARKSLEERRTKSANAIAAANVATEAEMRDGVIPRHETVEEMAAYITALVERPHDYGTCVYAMSMAAVAAYDYVAHKLGVTGFQASCADMDILRRNRGYKHGFQLVDYADVLYPQYWDEERAPFFQALMRKPETRQRFREEATKLLAAANGSVHPGVREHWEMLAGGA